MYKSTLIIPSNAAYYLNFFESIFLEFLKAIGASKKTQENYKTDIRHFFVWLVSEIEKTGEELPRPEVNILGVVDTDRIEKFKASLKFHKVPNATINRRLSSVRTFLTLCRDKGWILENPAEAVRNIPKLQNKNRETEEMIKGFRQSLLAQGETSTTTDVWTSEVGKFLQWLDARS